MEGMRMMKHGIVYGSIFLILVYAVYADPSVNSISGTVEHGQTITISGSQFGAKSPAAPLMWDDGEGKALNDPDVLTQVTGYSEAWPDNRFDVRDQWKLQYRNEGFRSVSGAHGHSSNYIAGGHWSDHDDKGRNVALTADSGSFPNEWYASWYVRLDPLWPTDNDECTIVPNYKDFVFQTGAVSYTYYTAPQTEGIFRYSACTRCIVREEEDITVNLQQACGGSNNVDALPRPSERFGWKRREVVLSNSPGVFDTFSYDGSTRVQSYDITCTDLIDYGIRSFTVGGFMKNSDSSNPSNPPYDYPNWSPLRDISDHWYTWVQRGTADVYYATFNGARIGDSSENPWIKVRPLIVKIGGVDSRTEGDINSLEYGEWVYGDFDSLGYNTMYVRLPQGTQDRNPGDNGPCYLVLTDDRQGQKGNGRTHPDAFRYFDDIYIDTTWSRVVLANNQDYDSATIVEPQIPSAWSGNSISATINLGAITDSTAYLFVFDADNNHNGGYEIQVGGSGSGACGNNQIETGEECDNGSSNGLICLPQYDESCSYCSGLCRDIIVQGAYCGDDWCDIDDENCTTCQVDCGVCQVECVHDADNNPCDRVVSISELIDYIDSWKAGEVSLQNVMGAIVAWKG